MADYLVRDTELEGIADAIRQKGGTSAQLMFPTEFVTAIGNLGGGAGAIGIVDEPDAAGGTIRHITAVDLSEDTVDAAHLISGYTAHDSTGAAIVGTNPGGGGQPTLQTKSVSHTPTESAYSTTVTPDTGYDGLSSVSVSVAAVASDYVGTGITRRSSTDLTASGATVSAPAGYYSTAASKAVATGSATAPASISGSTATISTSSNTITLTKTVSVTPSVSAGYVSSGTAGNSSVSLSATATINPTPTASGPTVTIPSGYYTAQTTKDVATGTATSPTSISASGASVTTSTNKVTFSAQAAVTPRITTAGYITQGTSGVTSLSVSANITTKAAETYTPTTTNQTIASQQYLTGAQTISGDANLVAGNIKSGTTIFGVTGTYSGGGGATNFVTGTFTTPTTTSTTGSIAVPYTGSGYPVMLVVVVEGGMYNSTVSTWYNSLTRYAVGQITIGKSVQTLSPSYGTSGSDNYGSVELIYKNSTSTSTSYSSTRSVSANSYSSSNANGTNTTCVRWKSNNKTISYRTGGGSNTSYGLLASTTYRYYAVYSS